MPLIIFLLLPFLAVAQQSWNIHSSFVSGNVAPHCSFVTSDANRWNIHSITDLNESEWNKCTDNLLFFQESDYAEDVWVRCTLQNTDSTTQRYILELNNALIDEVCFYHFINQQLVDSSNAGDAVAFDTRPILFRNPIYELTLAPNTNHTLYLRLNADGRKIHLPLILRTIPAFIAYASQKDLLFGLYYGALFCITMLYFYLAFILRDRGFFYLATYLLFLSLNQLSVSGFSFAYLWPHHPEWSNQSTPFFMGISIISGLLFAREFITTRHFKPIAHWIIYITIGITAVSVVSSLGSGNVLTFSMWLLYRLIPLVYLIMLGIGIYFLVKRHTATRLFVPAFMLAAISIGYMTFITVNKTADNIFTNNIVLYAVLLKCILLSMAMLDRLRLFKVEKEAAQANVIRHLEELTQYKEQINHELELKVEQKSREILQKQQEINKALISGEEKERKRVAQDLHDGMGSLLSTLRLNAESIDLSSKNLTTAEATAYQNVLDMIDRACTELRNISHNMMPSGIEHFGLKATLESVTHKLNQTSPTRFEIDTLGLERIENKDIALQVYRIVLELMNNIIKHAFATQATVQLIMQQQQLNIIVEDNGKGFNPANDKAGLGLLSVRSRVEAMEGKITIDTNAEGTTFIIEIPCNNL